MSNFDRYNQIHDEIMKRLEDDEITTEQAKDVMDLAFNKYIVESDKKSSDRKQILNKVTKMLRDAKIKYLEFLPELDDKINDDVLNIAILNFRQHLSSNNNDMSFTIEPTELLTDTIEKINKEIEPDASVSCDGNPKDMTVSIEFKQQNITESFFNKKSKEKPVKDMRLSVMGFSFFGKMWNTEFIANSSEIKKDNDLKNPNATLTKMYIDFCSNASKISENIEKRFCDEANKIMKQDEEYFTKRGVKLPIKSYKDFKTLQIKYCNLIYDHDKCPEKWCIAIRGEWDADPEHGFGLLFNGQSLVGIYLASDVM